MFGPKKISLQDIGIQSFGALISGFIGSLVILLCVFILSSMVDIYGSFEASQITNQRNPLFPFILSFITFFGSMSSIFLLSHLFSMIDPERYKKSSVVSGQLAVFGILTYICITPVYIYIGMQDYQNIMLIFIFHCLMLSFGSFLLLEILNNIRYILISFYACVIGVFFSSILSLGFFSIFESGYAKLISLLFLLPLIFGSLCLIKGVFELLYYRYYNWTNTDPFGDISYQIERDEQEKILDQTQKNTL